MIQYFPNDFVSRSIMLVFSVCLIFLEITRRRAAATVGGIQLLTSANALVVVNIALFAFHAKVPESLLIFTSTLSMITVALLTLASLRTFATKHVSLWKYLCNFLLSALALAWLASIGPNLSLSIALLAAASTLLFALSFIEVNRLDTNGTAEQLCAGVLLCLCLTNLVRALTILVGLVSEIDFIIELLPQEIYVALYSTFLLTLIVIFIVMVDVRLQDKLTILATRDRQTGAYTRTVFFELMNTELMRVQRSNAPMSFVMVDLDKFKTINDTWGHRVGDKVIADFVANTTSTLRSYDLLGRYGGDEFVILLPNTTKDEAAAVAERIRKGCTSSTTAGIPPYSISMGLCCTTDGHIKLEDFISAADQALYRAKEAGRNQVEACDYGVAFEDSIQHGTPPHAMSLAQAVVP